MSVQTAVSTKPAGKTGRSGPWEDASRERLERLEGTITMEPVECAENAGLRYVTDAAQGIRRRRRGKGFTYYGPDGLRIGDPETLQRIEALRIPPAWTDVWICPLADGHLQATGRDARGRKHYIYHPRWRKIREETKYNGMVDFGSALPRIRERTERDLRLKGIARSKVLATVVRLLETTLIRVGNKEYARANRSYGLTTLKDRHIDVEGASLRFQFRGKAGKDHVVEVHDRRLAAIVKRCRDLPGHELFQYADEEGMLHTIDSADVSAYLHETVGGHFSAKEFRTWGGTVLAALVLRDLGQAESEGEARKNIVEAVKMVSEQLGNKPSIYRKYYVHPAILEAYRDGSLVAVLDRYCREEGQNGDSPHGLRPEERAVLSILEHSDEAFSG